VRKKSSTAETFSGYNLFRQKSEQVEAFFEGCRASPAELVIFSELFRDFNARIG
jgi:hypothetical protein